MKKVMFLPVTPGKHNNFETLLGPLLADFISRVCQVPLDVVLNTISSFKDFEENYDPYLKQLKRLDIGLNKYDYDGSPAYHQYVEDLVFSLYQKKILSVSRENIAVCKCGRVEVLQDALEETLLNRCAKLISGNRCKHCGTLLEKKEEDVLRMSFSQQDLTFDVRPVRYKKKIQSILNRLRKNPFIASRHARTGQTVELKGKKFVLDADFHWMACINYFAPKNDHICLVAGSDCLNHVSKILSLSRLIEPSLKYTLIIHPLIEVVGSSDIFKNMKIDAYLDACRNKQTARTFLALGLQWARERTMLNSSDFHLVKQNLSPREIKICGEKTGEVDFLKIPCLFNRSKLTDFLKALKTKREISSDEAILKNNVSLI